MRRALSLIACAVLILAAAAGPWQASPALPQAGGQTLDGGPGRFTFADLGWSDDVLLAADSRKASVRFWIPGDDAVGSPDEFVPPPTRPTSPGVPVPEDALWYGIRLSYEWRGAPAAPGGFGQLTAEWNGHFLYSLDMRTPSDLVEGFTWAMADAIYGGSGGFEAGSRFVAASSNLAGPMGVQEVQEGWNELIINLSLREAGNNNIQVLIKKDSEVFATSWRPPFIAEATAKAKVEAESITLKAKGRNLGWGMPEHYAAAVVWREDGSQQDYSWELGELSPRASVEFEQTIPNEGDSPVYSIEVGLDYAPPLQAWPPLPGEPWHSRFPVGSTAGLLVSIVVLWVGVPMLFRHFRQRRAGDDAPAGDGG